MSDVTGNTLNELDQKIIDSLIEIDNAHFSLERRKKTPTKLSEELEEHRVSISRRLKRLLDLGILEKEKRGRGNFYYVPEKYFDDTQGLAVKSKIMNEISQINPSESYYNVGLGGRRGFRAVTLLKGLSAIEDAEPEIQVDQGSYSLEEFIELVYEKLKGVKVEVFKSELKREFLANLDLIEDEGAADKFEDNVEKFVEMQVEEIVSLDTFSDEILSAGEVDMRGKERFKESARTQLKGFLGWTQSAEGLEEFLDSLWKVVEKYEGEDMAMAMAEGEAKPSVEFDVFKPEL